MVERWERSGSLSSGHSAYHSKESSLPRMVKNLSQFSLLVKSPRVCRRSSEFAISSTFSALRFKEGLTDTKLRFCSLADLKRRVCPLYITMYVT